MAGWVVGLVRSSRTWFIYAKRPRSGEGSCRFCSVGASSSCYPQYLRDPSKVSRRFVVSVTLLLTRWPPGCRLPPACPLPVPLVTGPVDVAMVRRFSFTTRHVPTPRGRASTRSLCRGRPICPPRWTDFPSGRYIPLHAFMQKGIGLKCGIREIAPPPVMSPAGERAMRATSARIHVWGCSARHAQRIVGPSPGLGRVAEPG